METNTALDTSKDSDEGPPPPPEEKTFPQRPKYVGQYTRIDGYTLKRISDGYHLKALQRHPSQVTPSKTSFYLVDGSTGGYISSLYGGEFEHGGTRYTITRTNSERVTISVKSRKGRRVR